MALAAYEDEFTRYRRLLFSIAYRMLGTVTDAEDMVQETYLRWRGAHDDGAPTVAAPKSWLTTTITRLAIDHLRSARVRREEYVGPRLPEPILTSGTDDDPAEGVALADTLSLAFLVVLERLNPVERAVFLLHDVFGYDFAEIAPIVGKSAPSCRQLARRAQPPAFRARSGNARAAAGGIHARLHQRRFAGPDRYPGRRYHPLVGWRRQGPGRPQADTRCGESRRLRVADRADQRDRRRNLPTHPDQRATRPRRAPRWRAVQRPDARHRRWQDCRYSGRGESGEVTRGSRES